MRRTAASACLLAMALFLAGPAGAQGRKPPEKETKPEQKSTTLKDAKDGANAALNDLDRGIHKAAAGTKAGANQALQAVDDTVHGRKK